LDRSLTPSWTRY